MLNNNGNPMSDFYGSKQREYQDRFDTRRLADRVEQIIVHADINAEDRQFIEGRDLFFLSTIDHKGRPSCSYKGGDPGFVRVVDGKTIAFPSYDGNGMFYSLGNMAANAEVGLLFIDFEKPHRLRLHGTASVQENDPLLASFSGAQVVVRVRVAEIFVNCPRYVHQFKKVKHSPFVPKPAEAAPVPDWKRIDLLHDVLPERDRPQVAACGTITVQEYAEKTSR